LADDGAKTAAIAPQNIHSSNVRYWRKADIGLTGGERPLLTQSGHFGWRA
jgi:hypothetical protein